MISVEFVYNSLKHLRFKMFESFDASSISITYKASKDTTLKDSLKIVQTIENDLLKRKDEFFIDYVSSTAGYRFSAIGRGEMYPYVGYITMNLKKRAPSNFLEKYITPYLSFYYSKDGRVRTKDSKEIAKKVRKFIKKQRYKQRFNLRQISLLERRMRHTRADIMVGVIGTDYKKVIEAIKRLEAKLRSIDAVKLAGDNMKYGSREMEVRIHDYGKKLG